MAEERKKLTLKKKPEGEATGTTRTLRVRRRGALVEVFVNAKNQSQDIPKPKKRRKKKKKKKAAQPVVKKPKIQPPPKKKGPARGTIVPKERIPIPEAIELLRTYWPDLLDEEDRLLPLGPNALINLKADATERGLPINGKMIKRALASLTYTFSYRLSVVTGQPRYDKNGQVCGHFQDVEEADSKVRIIRMIKQQKSINPFLMNF